MNERNIRRFSLAHLLENGSVDDSSAASVRRVPASFGPADITLEAPSDSSSDRTASCHAACKVHLVEGSGSEISGEVHELLRSRLRSASLLTFVALAIFLVWHVFQLDLSPARPLALPTFIWHIIATLVVGCIGFALCSKQAFTTSQLRWMELGTCGVPAAFFMLMQYGRTYLYVNSYDFHPGVAPFWLLAIYTYAIFIPNTWKRAAVVLGIIASLPILTTVLGMILNTKVLLFMSGEPGVLVEIVLVMAVSAVGAVFGVYTINSLQAQAYQARQLGQYRLKKLIGSGGMGDVYLAEHQLMKRPCAIKVIRPEKAGDPKVLARFEREVQATAKLSHWNSIDIFDYGRADDGTFYYVMEYLPGMNLGEIVKRFGPMPAARVIHLVRQACDALQEAHDLGLLHRDLKPANLFAAVRGGFYDVAKLLDFGLAKPLSDLDTAQLTADGSITGSPLYMSPEQATGDKEPDPRSDIYSLGGVLYYLLTGHPPFEDEKPIKVLISHAHEPPKPLTQWIEEVPLDLEAIVMRCLAKSPDDRYQSAAELAAALDDCEHHGVWTRDNARNWWMQSDRATAQANEMAVM
ncbi:MAG: serine/threonine protein kinase [Pirellulaceae bacterium]|nr:serine/threonine protein kinase [Pirellulaceae bacterium]